MPMPTNIDPSAFYLEGGPAGVLMIHGYTGSTAEMRPIGQFLNDKGLTVLAPLLPGHGSSPDDLNNYGWKDWIGEANRSLDEIQSRCEQVFVAGLSMGALLSLELAATREDILGVITYAAAIDVKDWRRNLPRFITRIVKQMSKPDEHWADPEAKEQLWCYDTYPTAAAFELLNAIPDVKELLPQIHCPLLAIYSLADPTVSPEGAQLIYDQVSSTDKQLVELKECGHVLTVDDGWQTAAEKTYQFVLERLPKEVTAG